MFTLNKVELIGYIGQDLELKKTNNDNAVCNFSLSTKDNVKEETEWHQLVAWGKNAENLCKYMKKGSLVFVTGRLKYRTYTNKQGIEVTKPEIVVAEAGFLPSSKTGKATTTTTTTETEDPFETLE